MSAQEKSIKIEKSFIESGINDINFENIKRKLMLSFPEGRDWSKEQVDEAEKWYKRYLYLTYLDSNYPYVPNEPIDAFWHQHILDTREYSKDCDKYIGHFLHHFPYFGLNGDAKERDDSFKVTNKEYIKHFGEDCLSMKFFKYTNEESKNGSNCNDSGSGTGCGQGCSGGNK